METNDLEDSFYNEVGNYFLNNDKLHDVQFIVGEQKEKIKAVKLLLINQSKPWWSMLSEESPLMEKGDIHLPDIDPEVFTLLLKHSYGSLDHLNDLSNDTVVKLCYCANKYFMTSLMKKIATRLEPRNVEDLFPALYCFVCYNLKGVEEGVKKIVQTQTTKILDHAEFLECDVDSITYICKQESLNCDELTLWKAVVKWAKHKAQGGEGAQLRQWMSQPMQHIRLFTLSPSDLTAHVFALQVLNSEEIASICKQDPLCVWSLMTSSRYCTLEKKIRKVCVEQNAARINDHYSTSQISTSCIIIKNKSIELQSLVIRGLIDKHYTSYCGELLFYGKCFEDTLCLTITRITNLMNNTSDEEPVILKTTFDNWVFQKITIPTLTNSKGITLQANNKYKVELAFDSYMPSWKSPNCDNGHHFDHGTFHCSLNYNDGIGSTPCHILEFTYAVADD